MPTCAHPEAKCAPHNNGPARTEALFNSLYEDLCRLARREAWRNGAHDLVGTGTLVHEAWLDISHRPSLDFDAPGLFLAYAARTMRGLVIDRIRARQTQKRGGDLDLTSLDTLNADQAIQPENLDDIVEALDDLAAVDPELADVVNLRFFCGFTVPEVARMRGVSVRTVERQWEKARLLLYRAMS